jgi:hypothetical protein
MSRYVAGCMTGTSMDSFDISIVENDGYGLDMKVGVIQNCSIPLENLEE